MNCISFSKHALEARARRTAKSQGFRAMKSRRINPLENHGEFMIIDGNGIPQLGFKYDATAQDVIRFCAE
ncbi:hypothetical protein [Dechloromonas denitrificans]|uniref:hypothetical protein n=1 Tax=Dechloromonas denitrificans TaxID=281362 RepID=UPI0012FAA02A|nr:hypothetical protein [Dechloromonas denitrificans]